MSDLCYNCGDCHLPRPCTAELKRCEICTNYGHTYNFCPLSVRQKDPTYQFWALCHNCDKWHLPDACSIPLHKCHVCNHGGHKEFFCPVKPVPRGIPSGQSAGVKRQRTSGSDVSEAEHVTLEMVQKIKTDTAINVFAMLNKGYNSDDIMRHIAPNMIHMVAANPAPRIVAQNGSVPNTPTPAPAQAYLTRTENTPGLYSIMQDRFDRGDLKSGPTQNLTHRSGNQYAENLQNQASQNGSPYAESIHTQNIQNQTPLNGSHYAENFQATGGVQRSGNNINVGAATALQELAQSAVTGGATGGGPPSSLGPLSQAESFKEHLENAIATSVGDFNAGTPSLANASPSFASVDDGIPTIGNAMPHPSFTTVNVAAGDNMPGYQTHTMPPPPVEDSIAVATTEQEDPPQQLLLRKDGKPRKKQPTRNQPPRKKAA